MHIEENSNMFNSLRCGVAVFRFHSLAQQSLRLSPQSLAVCLHHGILPRNSEHKQERGFSIKRAFTTSSILDRTIWSLLRPPNNLPNLPLPKYLVDGKRRRGRWRSGRDHTGRIVIRHKGGGHQQNFRKLDMLRVPLERNENTPISYKLEVLQIGYDPCRTGRIALVAGNASDKLSLILVPDTVQVGDVLSASRDRPESLARLRPGDAYPLQFLPLGTGVHSIELVPGEGAKLVRSAGTTAAVLRKTDVGSKIMVTIKMPSKQEKDIDGNCLAVVGRVSNVGHSKKIIGKAGRSRWLGRRPRGRTGVGRWHHWKKRVGCRKKKE